MDNPFNRTGFDLPKDIDLVAEKLVHVSEEVISAVTKRIELTADNTAEQAFVNEAFGEYLNRFCCKTGAFLGRVNIVQVAKLYSVQGEEKTELALQLQAIQNVSPDWLLTDSKTLDAQMTNDPLGYFVFAVGELLWEQFAAHLPKATHDKTGHIIATRKIKWQVIIEKAHLHKRLSDLLKSNKLSWTKIHEANETVRRFLALFAPSKSAHIVKWSNTPLRLLEPEDIIRDCRYNIAEILKHELKARRLRKRVSYDDVLAITEIYEGKKNFRSQRKPAKMSITEHAELLLKDVMRETLAGNFGVREEVIRQSWRAEAVKQREQVNSRKRQFSGKAAVNVGFTGFKFKNKPDSE